MDNSTKYTYTALRLEQQPNAPVMYMLGVDAGELLEWASVPEAKADYMAGYQRMFSETRADEIRDFLASDPNNIIPGSVIVTVSGDAINTEMRNDGIVLVTIEVVERNFDDRLEELYQKFSQRLSEEERVSIANDDLDDELGASTPDEESEEEEIGIPESYIATLTAELRDAVEDFAALPKSRQDAIRVHIDAISKPGLIIDGQHRVYGAKNVSSHDVSLPIVLLPGLSTAEQVFHFYVLNNKAKPLSPMELRRTISTSLSNAEIDILWKRFDDAGVNPQAVRWTHKMNTDPRSPFKGL